MKYYPEVQIKEGVLVSKFGETTEKGLEISTVVRKEHKGIWYDQLCLGQYQGGYSEQEKEQLIKIFYAEVYKVIILGKVDPSLVDPDGRPIFNPSGCQLSEKERLSGVMEW